MVTIVQATHLLNIVIRVMDKATAPLKGVENNLKKVGKAATGMNKKFLGMGLGLTFFMFGVKMQLDRMLRSMFNIFQQAEGETGALIQRFNIMKASLAAISIAFFDAFAQSALFDFILTAVTTIADWFLNLSDNTRAWLSSSLFVFSGVILGLSFLGQALLAIFVLSGAPLVLTFGLIVIAIAAVVVAFIAAKDDIQEATNNISTDWDDFLELMRKPVSFDNIIDTLNEALLRMRLLLVDFVLWMASIPVLKFMFLPILGPIPLSKLTEGLTAEREKLLGMLEPSFGGFGGGASGGRGFTGGFGESNLTSEGIASAVGGGVILASGELVKELIKNPMPILDEDGIKVAPLGDMLSIFNAEDAEKLKKLEEQRQTAITESNKQLDKFDGLISAVNAIETKPQIFITVTSSSSSTTN